MYKLVYTKCLITSNIRLCRPTDNNQNISINFIYHGLTQAKHYFQGCGVRWQ